MADDFDEKDLTIANLRAKLSDANAEIELLREELAQIHQLSKPRFSHTLPWPMTIVGLI